MKIGKPRLPFFNLFAFTFNLCFANIKDSSPCHGGFRGIKEKNLIKNYEKFRIRRFWFGGNE